MKRFEELKQDEIPQWAQTMESRLQSTDEEVMKKDVEIQEEKARSRVALHEAKVAFDAEIAKQSAEHQVEVRDLNAQITKLRRDLEVAEQLATAQSDVITALRNRDRVSLDQGMVGMEIAELERKKARLEGEKAAIDKEIGDLTAMRNP